MTFAASVRHPRRITVLIVGPSLDRWLGGQEVQADQLLREWFGDDAVEAVFIASNPPLRGLARSLERIPLLRTLARMPLRLTTMWSAARRCDVVHVFAGAHSSFVVGTLPALVIAHATGVRSVVHYHSGRGGEHLRGSAIARGMLRGADAVVVPSRYLADQFAAFGIKVSVVPNVVDDTRFHFRAPCDGPPLVVCARNFESIYAVDDAIRAFAIVQEEVPSARLALAGAGREEQALRALVRKLSLRNVQFAGRLTRDGMSALLARATVMINASRIDNMPVSILEAFACGVAVASTAAGGIPWFAVHERTALLSSPGDVAALARHVVTLIREPKLAASLAASARAETERYSWRCVREQWLNIYGTLVLGPAGKAASASWAS